MKISMIYLSLWFLFAFSSACGQGDINWEASNPDDLLITATQAKVHADLGVMSLEITVKGQAGQSTPQAVGQMDGAPVLGYVFPTTLKPEDVGFSSTEGIVALALTAHPDFDDTPLWDEDADKDYANDGVQWHPHWVVLQSDERVAGGLSVKEFSEGDDVTLPPTNPGMSMYMDSPGFPVVTKGNTIRVTVPLYRISHKTDFKFDAVAVYMQVNGSDENRPMLGVYQVYSVASGDLSLPYEVN